MVTFLVSDQPVPELEEYFKLRRLLLKSNLEDLSDHFEFLHEPSEENNKLPLSQIFLYDSNLEIVKEYLTSNLKEVNLPKKKEKLKNKQGKEVLRVVGAADRLVWGMAKLQEESWEQFSQEGLFYYRLISPRVHQDWDQFADSARNSGS